LTEFDNGSTVALGKVRRATLLPQPIPELRPLDRWIVWKEVWRSDRDKPDKVPCNPLTGRAASVTSTHTGKSLEIALRRLGKGRHDGLGLILRPPMVGVDLDNCRDPLTGRIEPWALEIVEKLDSYTEISPTGTGLHTLSRGVLPRAVKTKRVEMYWEGRYFTNTGKHLDGTPTVISHRVHELMDLYSTYTPPAKQSVANVAQQDVLRHPIADQAVLKLLTPQGQRLYRGNVTGYKSQSEADLALCRYLSLLSGSQDEIYGWFKSSGLMRSKWDKPYGLLTVRKVLSTSITSSSNVLKRSFPLDQSVEAKYGVPRKVSQREWATWRTRLLIEEGTLTPPAIDLLALPPAVPPRVVKAYEGFRLLLDCSWSQFPDEPIMFSTSFASRWCPLAHRHAHSAIHWLVENDYIRCVGQETAQPLRATPLYLPGKGRTFPVKPSWLGDTKEPRGPIANSEN
jgi:putative DNA primase/helicase